MRCCLSIFHYDIWKANALVSFTLNPEAFSYFDDRQNKWVLEPGEFDIMLGQHQTKSLQQRKSSCKDLKEITLFRFKFSRSVANLLSELKVNAN